MVNIVKKKRRGQLLSPAVVLLCMAIVAGTWLLDEDFGILSLLFVPEQMTVTILLLLTLLLLGPKLERIFGSVKLILLYCLVGATGAVFFHFYSPETAVSVPVTIIGGLVGAYFLIVLKRHYAVHTADRIIFFIYAGVIVVLSFGLELVPSKEILSGVVIGIILSFMIKPQSFKQVTMVRRKTSWMKSVVSLALIAAAFYCLSLFDWSELESEIPGRLNQWAKQMEEGISLSKAKEEPELDREADAREKGPFAAPDPSYKTGDKMYNMILKAIENKKKRTDLSIFAKSSDDVFDTLKQVLQDHPELYYFDHSGSSYWSNGILQLSYKYSKADIKKADGLLDAAVQDVLGQMAEGDSEHDRVKIVHDYIVKNTAYDYDNYLAGTIPDESYSILGNLLYGTAVCEGYAKSMQFLLTRAGVESVYVTGTGNGEGHAWNKVKVDGKWYNVDATWDDPVPDRADRVSYDYFLVTDKKLAEDHAWKQADLPVANDAKYMKKSRAVFR